MSAVPPTLVMEIIPPRVSQRAMQDVETTMQALTSTLGRPLALELVGTTQSRRFIVRASTMSDAQQLVGQLRARYPQAEIRCIDPADDPLQVQAGETVSIVELGAGAASYLPLRTWKERDWEREGADPLLGQLAALAQVPTAMRAIAQLALVAAPADWSAADQRFAVEHPLEHERQAERARTSARSTSTTSFGPVLLVLGLMGVAALWLQLLPHLPLWVRQAQTTLLQGHLPQLTTAQQDALWVVGIGLCALVVAVLALIIVVKRRFQRSRPIYDQRLVQEKTGRMAYRARLRLIVIGPHPTLPAAPLRRWAWQTRAASLRTALRQQFTAILAWWRTFTGSPPQRARALREVGSALAWRWEGWRQWWHVVRQIQSQRRQLRGERLLLLAQLQGAYRQFHLATGAFFIARRVPVWRARQLVRRGRGLAWLWTGWQRGVARSRHFLSVADCAALWHLPQGTDLPDLGLVEHGRARTRLVPAALTQGGQRLGVSTHAGQSVPVYLPPAVLQRNFLAVAKSGKGKSTLMLALALAAFPEPQSGVTVIDPHGDLVERLLMLIPDERRDQTILIDLADTAYPVALNPLDASMGGDRDAIVAQLIAIFTAIWTRTWGSRMEAAFEIAAKTLYEANRAIIAADPENGPDQQYTLLDIKPVLTVKAFRLTILEKVTDNAIKAWWWEEYELKTARDQEEMISPVLTKMNKFAASVVARRIVGQPRTTVSLPQIVGTGQILLVSTGHGVIGEDIASILGALLLGLLGTTMAAQAAVPEAQRRRMHILVDEFQTLPGVAWGRFLSELRKYQASFVLATQALAHLDKIDPQLRPTVMANIDQLAVFGVSAEDARILEPELDSVVDRTDLINLDDFTAYCKVTRDGQRLPVFSLRMDPPPVGDPVSAASIRQASRRRLSGSPAVIDAAIDARIKVHLHYVMAVAEALEAQEEAERAREARKRQKDHEREEARVRKEAKEEADRHAEELRQWSARLDTSPVAKTEDHKPTRRGNDGGQGKTLGEAPSGWYGPDPRADVDRQRLDPASPAALDDEVDDEEASE